MRDDAPDFRTKIGRWVRNMRNAAARRMRTWAQSLSVKKGSKNALPADRLTESTQWLPTALAALGIILLATVCASLAGLFLSTKPLPMGRGGSRGGPTGAPPTIVDTGTILKRNMFNVEGKIPDPFDQGMLDCMSQAKATSARLTLMGTIVMNDEAYSVALLQEEGSGDKIGVRKDETFGDGKFVALKVDRKRLCFQVKSTQEFEYVEIPDEGGGLKTPTLGLGSPMDGVTAISENEFAVKKATLDMNIGRMNEILQTARAVPYIDRDSGKFRGFLVQTIEPDSPFAALGIKQGDVIVEANGVALDNPGKALEVFQKFKDAKKVSLRMLRGGSEKSLSYEVRP